MTFRQKRSNSRYGLRKKVVKKKLDKDFEYNFSKEPHHMKSFKTSNRNNACDKNVKEATKIKGIITKKQRERPPKMQVENNVDSESLGISGINSDLLKLKKKNKTTIVYIDPPSESDYTTVNAICEVDQQGAMSISHEEVVGDSVDLIWTKLKVDSLEVVRPNGEDEGSLEEERGGMECLPDSAKDTKSNIIMGLSIPEAQADPSSDFKGKTITVSSLGTEFANMEDDLQDLKHLTSDHKIKCNECHKFLKPSSYRQHLRTHTGEKPFSCSLCVARFTRKGDVLRHVRIVHNKQKPFKCPRCQRAFGDKKNLRWHLMNHDKKLFYICETCGFKFGKREYWENHVRFIHPVATELLDLNKNQEDCEEKAHKQVTATDQECNTEEICTNKTSQTGKTTILSIQSSDGSKGLLENFPENQSSPQYTSLNNVGFCNFIKFEEFEPTRYEDGRESTDHVVIELSQEENQQLGIVASHSYNVIETVDSNHILHVQHAQNICKTQDLPIIIETHQYPVTISNSNSQVESSAGEADATKVRHIITGILLGESGSVPSENNERTVVNNFLNAFIDMSHSNSDNSSI